MLWTIKEFRTKYAIIIWSDYVTGEKPCSKWEVSCCCEYNQRNGEVDVKVVGDDGHEVHVAHDPGVGSLHDGRFNDVRVHVDQGQEVQAERGRQSAQKSAGEKKCVPESILYLLICTKMTY